MIDIKIEIINQLKDNYSYLLHHDNSLAIVIDPADDEKIINVLESKKLKLECIFITHHHSDHTSGVLGLIKNSHDKFILLQNCLLLKLTIFQITTKSQHQ